VAGLVGGSTLIYVINYALNFLGVKAHYARATLGVFLVLVFSIDFIRRTLAERSAKEITNRNLKALEAKNHKVEKEDMK
jgi:ribose/xylose/arabinose/galactoside ABC-type transport system permease subunit